MNPPPRKHRKSTRAAKLAADEIGRYEQVNSSGSEAGSALAYCDDHFSSDMKDTLQTRTTLSARRERTGSDISTDTISSQISAGTKLVKSLQRDGPRPAWSEAVEMNVRSTARILKNKQDPSDADVLQTSFENGGYSADENHDMNKLLATLDHRIQTTTAMLEDSKLAKTAATKNANKAKSDIERRKKAVKQAILKYVQSLNNEIDEKSRERAEELDRSTDALENRVYRMKKTLETYSKPSNGHYRQPLSERLKEFDKEVTENHAQEAAIVSKQTDHCQYHVVTKQSDEEFRELIEKLLGTVITGTPANDLRLSTDASIDLDVTLKSGSLTSPRSGLATSSILSAPELITTFSCHFRKDKRTCGITDVAMTDDGTILVVDKHNKAVKLYDSNGAFERYVGHAELHRPSRVSFLPLTNDVIVSDDDTRTVHSFSADGVFQKDLLRMRFPVGHCQLGDGRIAIIEFVTKSIVICNVGGKIETSFATKLDCPAYIACTRSGHLVVSDWKGGCVKAFDVNGEEQRSWTKKASGDALQPYGVCTDARGHVIVADRQGRSVVFYNEDGALVRTYDDEKHKIGIPFAVACNSTRELMVVAEYSGTVRVYKYLAPSSSDTTNC